MSVSAVLWVTHNNGEITRWGSCFDVDVPAGAIAGPGTSSTHYVAGGAIVAYTPAQAASKAAQPSYAANWSNDSFSWVDLRTLDDHKTARWATIKEKREAVEFGGFTWSTSRFDSDSESQSRIQGAAQLATLAMLGSQPFSVDWTLADNTVRTLTIADMLAAGQAMGVHIMTTHGIGRALRTAIESATTAAAVEGVTWPA